MRNIKILLQYDGTNYLGWQIQPSGRTIQSCIQNCLLRITGENINVIAAGRTDAGVHAIGQTACFMTCSQLSTSVLQNALNSLLPSDVRITEISEVDSSFHARYSARKKSYVYLLTMDRNVSPFIYRYVWRIPYNLDAPAMRSALSYITGTHDFSAFRGSGCGARTTVRTLHTASLVEMNAIEVTTIQHSGSFMKFRFEGDAFLRHMVRNLVGTIVEVGRGKLKAEDMTRILESKDRKCAGMTAPANGLFLENITY
ncbi:MAG TPA: tRNA pseudouridine(38-40) synthase TruA [Dissulfurispiraceae bacterium]|nr:tRNA pseudouridine(38-40) synthase TruA [Dissulfurispiraceae bacterium]